jgi:glutamate mutase epsilon subunit
MARTVERCTEIILRRVFEESRGDLSSDSPMVFSCGGVYIPHPRSQARMLQHIIVTGDSNEPVKVKTGVVQRNVLRELLAKESMN